MQELTFFENLSVRDFSSPGLLIDRNAFELSNEVRANELGDSISVILGREPELR